MSDPEAGKTADKLPGKPFQKGDDPRRNLDGRPVGSGISITTEIRKKFAELVPGEKATYLELYLKRILKAAIQDGDIQMIKQIWQYIDGMPRQKVELAVDGQDVIERWKKEWGIDEQSISGVSEVDTDNVREAALPVSEGDSQSDTESLPL